MFNECDSLILTNENNRKYVPKKFNNAICEYKGSLSHLIRCFLPNYGFSEFPKSDVLEYIHKSVIFNYPNEFEEIFKVKVLPTKLTSEIKFNQKNQTKEKKQVGVQIFNSDEILGTPPGFIVVETVEEGKVNQRYTKPDISYYLVPKIDYMKQIAVNNYFSCNQNQYEKINVDLNEKT